MGVAKGYLLLYNVAQSVGWALALFQTLRAIVQDGSLDHVYPAAGLTVRECLALHWQRLPKPLPDVPRPLASFLTTELCHAVSYAVGHAAADQAVAVAGVCQGAAVLEIVHAAAGAVRLPVLPFVNDASALLCSFIFSVGARQFSFSKSHK